MMDTALSGLDFRDTYDSVRAGEEMVGRVKAAPVIVDIQRHSLQFAWPINWLVREDLTDSITESN